MAKNKASQKVSDIMKGAINEAKNFSDNKLKPEHIMLSLLYDTNNQGVQLLENINVNIDNLIDNLTEHLKATQTTPRLFSYNRIPFSPETTKLMSNIDRECTGVSDSIIEPVHLILAILMIKTPVTNMLFDMGVTHTSFKNFYMTTKESQGFTNKAFEDDEFGDMKSDKFQNKQGMKKDSKTPALDGFCRDLTKAAEKKELDPVIGREKEIKRACQILSRRKKSNVIIIGQPGTGKSAIVDGLAQLIKDGKAPRPLMNKKIYSLDLASVVAGTKFRGQFEERMKAILEECKANKDILLFIDEIHTIVGAGNSSGSLDASNIFKPALSRGEIQIIGATTLDEYRENIEKDAALTRRFQSLMVEEPTLEECKTILMNIKDKYEQHHKVKYTDEAIEECVKLSNRYIMDRGMPDKAIDVMDESGAITNVSIEKPENIKHLEKLKADIILKKLSVVNQQRYEDAAKLRDEEKLINENLTKAMDEWNKLLSENVTIVDVDMVSEVVSMMSGVPVTKLSIQENKKLANIDKELIGKIIGQNDAVIKICNAIKRSRIGIKNKQAPSSFLCLGPTGTGKSLLAKLLAEYIYGDGESLIRVDMSEYGEKHNVARLIGAPPGYIGHEQGGQLTEKVRRKPYCVLLLDEIEKAHDDVFNILLQVLDEGHLTDGLGRKINFKNCLIIMTSNIGVKELNEFGPSVGFKTTSNILSEETRVTDVIHKALKKKFKPEFLNRISETIIFNPLSEENINSIIYNELAKLQSRLVEMGYKLNVEPEAVKYVAHEGYDQVYGARPLNRAIEHLIEDPIADEILNGNIKDGSTITVKLKDGVIFITNDNPKPKKKPTKKDVI